MIDSGIITDAWEGNGVAEEGVLEQCWDKSLRVTEQLKTCHTTCLSTMLQLCKASLHLFILLFQLSLYPHSQMTGKIILQLHIWNPNLNKSSRAGMTATGLDPPLFTQIFTSADFKGDSPDLHRGRYKPMNLHFPKSQTWVKQEPLWEQLRLPFKSCLWRKHFSC